jgi:hypothetical protein
MGLTHHNVINNNILVVQQTGINASIGHKVGGQLSTQIQVLDLGFFWVKASLTT